MPHKFRNRYPGIFAGIWAKDASGNEVATSYEIRGDALVQKVGYKQQDVSLCDPSGGCWVTASAAWGSAKFCGTPAARPLLHLGMARLGC